MSNSIAKQLKMSYYPQLDNMDMADVSNFLELNEEKHHIAVVIGWINIITNHLQHLLLLILTNTSMLTFM